MTHNPASEANCAKSCAGTSTPRKCGMNNIAMLLEAFEVSESEAQDFREHDIGLFGVDKGRVSSLLLVQLTSALKQRSFNTFSVTDVIRHLEGLLPTRLATGPEQFKYSPLSHFWKAHFTDARFLLRNVYNELGIFSNKSNKLKSLCERVIDQEESEPSAVGWQGRLAHALTVDAYEARAARKEMTGEWIIYGKHEGRNYYLCIAKHSSTKEVGQEIYRAIRRFCENEFPFLFSNTA